MREDHVQMQENIESKASTKELEQIKQEMEKKFKAMEKKIIENDTAHFDAQKNAKDVHSDAKVDTNVTASMVASGSQVDHTSGTDATTGLAEKVTIGLLFLNMIYLGRRLKRLEESKKLQLTNNAAQTIDDVDTLSQASTTLPYDSGLPHAFTVGAYSPDVP